LRKRTGLDKRKPRKILFREKRRDFSDKIPRKRRCTQVRQGEKTDLEKLEREDYFGGGGGGGGGGWGDSKGILSRELAERWDEKKREAPYKKCAKQATSDEGEGEWARDQWITYWDDKK